MMPACSNNFAAICSSINQALEKKKKKKMMMMMMMKNKENKKVCGKNSLKRTTTWIGYFAIAPIPSSPQSESFTACNNIFLFSSPELEKGCGEMVMVMAILLLLLLLFLGFACVGF
jgi:hypothetical protein